MVYIDELKPLKLYKRQFLLPRNGMDKKHNNAVMLLTPNEESTVKLLNHPLMNKRNYISYYLEKDVSFMISNEGYLDHMKPGEKYVHETDIGEDGAYVNEGVFNHYKEKIIYNGYVTDVARAKFFINCTTIKECNENLDAKIKWPISVTVYKGNPKVVTDERSINISDTAGSGSDEDYYYYTKEEMYTLLVKSINPKVNKIILESVVMTLAGTYDKYNSLFNSNEIPYTFWCENVKSIIAKPNGYRKLVDIIKKNDISTFTQSGITNNKVISDFLSEGTMDPVSRLKRYITYKSNRGSKHLLNAVNNKIEDTVDPTTNNPKFKEKNDIDKGENTEDIDVPVIDYTDPAAAHIPVSQAGGSPKKESYQLFDVIGSDEYYMTESYLRTQDTITYFEEASNVNNAKLRKMLYRERLRTNRQVFTIYDDIKNQVPSIKYTYINLNRYKNRNLFVDLRYYNELFFKNNMYKMDKGVDLYFSLLSNMINNKKLTQNGYDKKRLVLIPIEDWDIDPNTKMWMYNKDINPISVLYRIMKRKGIDTLKKEFKDVDFVFISSKAFFRVNFNNFKEMEMNKFLVLIRKLRSGEAIEDNGDEKEDSRKAIIDTIVDDIESNERIKISHLTGTKEKDVEKTSTSAKKKEKVPESEKPANTDRNTSKEEERKEDIDKKKKEVISKIEDVADKSTNVDDAYEQLNQDEWFKKVLAQLADEEQDGIVINSSRSKRMSELNTKFLDKEVKGKSVKDILENRKAYNENDIPAESLPVDSINKEWEELVYTNINKIYDPNDDIVAMLYDLHNKTYPLSIRDIAVTDTSTSEDYIYTYNVSLESHEGKRFSIKFDIPKFKNNQYMMLRGNKKVISSQSFLMPILKTDDDTVQIISNYNKIFIRRFGTTTGKSNEVADRIIKTINKYGEQISGLKVVTGDNAKVCEKYNLPIDYIDLASQFTSVETSTYLFMFNPDEVKKKFNNIKGDNNTFVIGYNKNTKSPLYCSNADMFSERMYDLLITSCKDFREYYEKTSKAARYTYAKASILSTEIPVVVVAAYSEGLTSVLNKAGIDYEITEKKLSAHRYRHGYEDFIKFKDGFISYTNTYTSSLLMNGLKECATDIYSITEINSKSMYLDFLDGFGGRIKADGIDNFYDCMIDPITKDVLEHYHMPTDYIQLLVMSCTLLADNDYYKHGDMVVRRLRKNEIVAGYAYKAIAGAYGSYATSLKHGRETIMSMKQSAVIDMILLDPTSSDSSFINPLAEAESYTAVTTKGLSGMNSDRSYSLDKRSFDDSMVNVLGMSTSFAGNVGISRQATINANINTARGYVQQSSQEDMNSVNSLAITEALTPMGTTRDDPFRTAMTFIQTSKHGIRVRRSDPCLITNGASQALPYLISDTFAHKAKGKGEVVEFKEDDYMVVQYNDNSAEYIDLSDRIEKNSASGFYQVIKLDTDLKLGSKVKENDIVAYDRLAFSPNTGANKNIEYNIGTLVKCAMLDTDEGFEDSAIISEELSEALSSDIVVKKELNLPKNTNIYKMLEPGTPVQEGDTLMIMQSPFDEEDANTLLKQLVDDPEEISNLGRIQIKSKVTGVVQAIEVYRTVDMNELSDSLKKLCRKFESNVKTKKSIMEKYNIDQKEELLPDYKLPATGKLKGAGDGVQIIFYLKYTDKMSVGDKLIYWSANKGVVKGIFPKGKEPYCLSEPDEKLHTLVSIAAINGRMVSSIQNVGQIQYLLVEATKKAKDMAGLKYDYNKLV